MRLNKRIAKSGIWTALVMGLLVASPLLSESYAATTGSIILSGTVSAQTAITVTGATGYNSLDLSTTQSNLLVATVREVNNTNTGYTVTMSSDNGGQLKNGTAGQVAYTAQYNGVSASLSTTAVNITNAAASSSPVNVVKNLNISYTGQTSSNLMVGTYSDTLHFTIAAN